MESEREATLRRVLASEHRMRSLVAYDRANPIFSVNLTMQQLRVLLLLRRHDGMTSQELTRHLGVTSATTTGIIDRLVAQTYVTRSEDPHDRRIRRISLSPEGRALMADVADGGARAQRRLLERLDDDTLSMLEIVLQHLIEAAAAEAEDQGVNVREMDTCTTPNSG